MCCALMVTAAPVAAESTLFEDEASSLQLSGDLRLRLEQDWSSLRGDGTERDDRLRVRGRARLRLDAQIDDNWSAVLRVRSGSDDSQQSPHITLYDADDNDTGDADFNFDLWYGQFQSGGWRVWAGRNRINLWRQDEYILDDDVTAPGLGITYTHQLGGGELSWNGGLGSLPAGMRKFSGQYASGQVVYEQDNDDYGFTLAGTYLGIDADADNANGAILLTDNSTRDYQTAALQAQLRLKSFTRPLTIGVAAERNLENYDDEPPGSFSEFHKDDVDFYTFFVNWGSSDKRGDWLLGYYYSYIEALAINSSYSEDDWVRWGSATQTRASNLKGSEFRLAYGVADNMNIVVRLYLVDAIDLLNATDTAKEDGNRARIDFNLSF